MSNNIHIRHATEEDIPFILACEKGPETTLVHGDPEAVHKKNIPNSDYSYLIAETPKGELLGFSLLVKTDETRTEWRRIIMAKPSGGYGKTFMRQVIDTIFEGSAELIWLDVYEENTRAIHVYQSLGFIETYREPSPKDASKTLLYMALERP